ncbi:MAG: cadmium-translocating P-type ATPase [Planctomycetota bacterium]|nr:MAG: cadmium-translocating P-type ATPase [Planctomycetota bacterium]
MSNASPTAAAAHPKPPPGGGAAGTFALNETIAVGVLVALAIHGLLRFSSAAVEVPGLAALWAMLPAWRPLPPTVADLPLLAMLLVGGAILVAELLGQVMAGVFGADLLAGVAILTSVCLGEWLAGVLVVLMLSGGKALEARAVSRAGSVLAALARRMPTLAHRREGGGIVDVPLAEVAVGEVVVVFPHEICPVDGEVVAGHGTMDESYLTGEPWQMQKAPGVAVLSGAINGQGALEIRAARVAGDSRYARIVDVLRSSEEHRPRLRRLADSLGALYAPLALAVAGAAWWVSGEATRFLAVLVVATPCPLLIAIPVAIIGAVSLAARRGIVIRDPAILERIATCRTGIFDKTGTLTYGTPHLTEVVALGEIDRDEILRLAAALEAYSKHPLAAAVTAAAADLGGPLPVEEVSERPGQGLTGRVGPAGATREVAITSRTKLAAAVGADGLPAAAGGLECVVVVDDLPVGLLRFRDHPRQDGATFVEHLGPAHGLTRVMLVSGDRESEVRWLADHVGIKEVHAGISPEGKLRIVEEATREAPTLFVGDGINDAPALAAATVGIAMGTANDVTGEAAGAVVMDSALERVDELFHIGKRLRTIALQSAVGGMAASFVGMGFAAAGLLSPAVGALVQEAIDVVAVLNALRVASDNGQLTDYGNGPASRGD